jgi:hypothetical protein
MQNIVAKRHAWFVFLGPGTLALGEKNATAWIVRRSLDLFNSFELGDSTAADTEKKNCRCCFIAMYVALGEKMI